MGAGYEAHRERIRQISEKVTDAAKHGKTPTIYHDSSHSVRPENVTADEKIHIERLNHFIDIDEENRTVLMEPDISMRELVNKTLEHGLVPHIVPEFPTITVGGAIQGGAGESSCFKYGLFGDHCTKFELVTGKGAIVTATADQNRDLFYGTLGSYGSLGILTEVEMNLLPAKDFVKVTYIPVESFADAQEVIDRLCESDVDFIDGILFAKDRGVIMTGTMYDETDLPVSRFTRARDDWFYVHADKISRKGNEYEELIPIRDYFFRYDIGAFWALKYGYQEAHLPFNRLTRTLFYPLNSTAIAYKAGIHGGNFSSEYIIQDIITKKETTVELLRWADKNLGIYPIWLLPLTPEKHRKLAPSYLDTDLAINVGIWGRPQRGGNAAELKKRLEKKQIDLGARKTLYAQQFYSEDEFWSIYDQTWYQTLRTKYDATDTFPSIYDVTHVENLPDPSLKAAAKHMAISLLSKTL